MDSAESPLTTAVIWREHTDVMRQCILSFARHSYPTYKPFIWVKFESQTLQIINQKLIWGQEKIISREMKNVVIRYTWLESGCMLTDDKLTDRFGTRSLLSRRAKTGGHVITLQALEIDRSW